MVKIGLLSDMHGGTTVTKNILPNVTKSGTPEI